MNAVFTVLVVEDDRDIREALGEVLQAEGYRVLFAADGCEALEEARRGRPNVIVLDLMMPRMTGWEFRELQQRDASIAKIPVIVCSAADTTERLIDAAEFVPKPCEVDAVLDAVARHTAREDR